MKFNDLHRQLLRDARLAIESGEKYICDAISDAANSYNLPRIQAASELLVHISKEIEEEFSLNVYILKRYGTNLDPNDVGRHPHHTLARLAWIDKMLEAQMTNEDLVELLRTVAKQLNESPAHSLQAIVAPLRAVTTPGYGTGRGAEMDHTDAGFELQLKWYAGQLLDMVDEQQLFAVNSWINCSDKFTTRREP